MIHHHYACAIYLNIHESLSSSLKLSRSFPQYLQSVTSCSQPLNMRSCHRAFLLAVAIVVSFWISFTFGKGAQFDDWHYEYKVLSYGPSREEKFDNFPRTPAKFISTGNSRRNQVFRAGNKDLFDFSAVLSRSQNQNQNQNQ